MSACRTAARVAKAALLAVTALAPLRSARAAEPWEGLTVERIRVRGTRKVEPEAIRMNLVTREGTALAAATLAEDVRALWRMGFFEDAQVDVRVLGGGRAAVTYLVREKPAVRKIVVTGNDEVDIDKINEVLDLRRDQVLDVSQVKRNAQKIRDLYTEKGFFLAEVAHELKRVSDSEVDVHFHVRERAKVEVRRVTFIGNRAATDEDLKGVMQTQEGGHFSWLTSSGTYREDAFERDLLLVSGWYYDHGYVNVKVGRPEVDLSADKRYLYVTIPIEEGPQYKLASIDVRGDLLGPREQHMALVTVAPGEVFSRSKLLGDIERLTSRYRDLGYAYANVTPLTDVDNDKLTVGLVFEVERGSKVTVDRIHIRGNSKTRDKVIRRELKIYEQDLYNQSKIDLSRRRIFALGFFEDVDITTRRGATDDRIDLYVQVRERPTGTFQVGAGFSSVENFIAQAQVSQNNLLGRGQLLALQAQLSGLRQLYSLRFFDPNFLDSEWNFGFDLYNSIRSFETFNREATGGDLTWGYNLLDDLRLFLTYTLEDVAVTTRGRPSLFGTPTAALPSDFTHAHLFDDGVTSSLRLSVSWDTRDNRLFPTSGTFHNVAAEFAEPELGSENNFERYTAFTRWFFPVLGPLVLRLNGETGLVKASRRPQGVPIFERFFLGGIFDVRGFRPRSLGPRIDASASPRPDSPLFGFNIGGDKQLILQAELEYPIFEEVGIKAVVFSDAGWAWNDDESMFREIDKLRHSWGFGFRWFSPIGPLRFEWGIPFDPQPGEDPIVFEFTIGNPF